MRKYAIAALSVLALVGVAWAADINDLDVTDASNTARFPENMARSAVNDGLRALEGIIARGWKDAVEGNKDSTGSSNAYAVAANRTITAYYDGLRVGFHASFANTSTASLNYDSVGAKEIMKLHDQQLAGGEIEANQYVEVVYSATDDAWQLISANAVTPLVNVIEDTTPQLGGQLDINSQSILWASGVTTSDVFDEDDLTSDSATALATQQSIKAYVDDQISAQSYISIFESPEATITAGAATTIAHGLGAAPQWFDLYLVCQDTDAGYSAGDKLWLGGYQTGSSSRGVGVTFDATNLYVRFGSNSGDVFRAPNKSSGTDAALDVTKWTAVFVAGRAS